MRHKTKLLLVSVASILCVGNVSALETDASYAFANYLGSGIYRTDGQTLQIYLIPFVYNARKMAQDQSGIKIKLPVTLGFADFKFSQIDNTGLPDEAATGSFIPGIELLYPVNDNWTVIPFLDAGVARNFTANESVYVYSGGIKHRLVFSQGNKQFVVGNKLLYAAHTGLEIDGNTDFSSFETGVAMQFPLELKILHRQLDFGLYYINYRYYDDLEFLEVGTRLIQVEIQNEVGFTFGLKKLSELDWIDLPRFGLGYRYGDNFRIIRLVLGVPF